MSAKVIPNIVVIRFQICIFDILNTAEKWGLVNEDML